MALHHIEVRAVPGGWQVTANVCDLPLMFLSGARAEAQARRLAEAIQGRGGDAEICIRDRSGGLLSRLAAPACAHDEQPRRCRRMTLAEMAALDDPRRRRGLVPARGEDEIQTIEIHAV